MQWRSLLLKLLLRNRWYTHCLEVWISLIVRLMLIVGKVLLAHKISLVNELLHGWVSLRICIKVRLSSLSWKLDLVLGWLKFLVRAYSFWSTLKRRLCFKIPIWLKWHAPWLLLRYLNTWVPCQIHEWSTLVVVKVRLSFSLHNWLYFNDAEWW